MNKRKIEWKKLLIYLGVLTIGIIGLLKWQCVLHYVKLVLSFYFEISLLYGLAVLILCFFYYPYLKKESFPSSQIPSFLYSLGKFPYLVLDSLTNILFIYSALNMIYRILSSETLCKYLPSYERWILGITFSVLLYLAVDNTFKKFRTVFTKEVIVKIEGLSSREVQNNSEK